jgi:hypothetical protein
MDDDINRYPMLHPILRPSKVGADGTQEVKDELEILVHTISERVTRMKADDPGAWEAAGDSLARDMAEFVAKRDRPKT